MTNLYQENEEPEDSGSDEKNSFFEYQRPKIYTVSSLTEDIKGLLEERFDFIWV
jgi:hypothetical protein